ncbi:MAG: replication-associated recombination protein A [Candidatus Eisenbacteria bacterium]|nr:replication-associated recombination protein A [Candidatus Eisenbacteria bacterium]
MNEVNALRDAHAEPGGLFTVPEAPHAPLAKRMRPRALGEYRGQDHVLGPGKLLRRAIEADRLFSMILYGPPGSGKTSLGHVIAEATGSALVRLNAVEAGVADLRAAVTGARQRSPRRTIVFIDEVHRFNKAQQDVLLAPLEDDAFVMIGATVENPFFYLNQALLSRVQVFEFRPLSRDDVRAILVSALADRERGLGEYRVEAADDALDHLADNALGDARRALSALELAALSTPPDKGGAIRVSLAVAEGCLARRVIRHDRDGDAHYDVASAFIKSVRGSQPDAALFWLARMLEGGEDPRFIARRLVILASEDVGLADPGALGLAVGAARAVEMLGLPEARYALAEATIYLAAAPKSRACADAIAAAEEAVRTEDSGEVPAHLRAAGYAGAARLGRGAAYEMPRSEAEGRRQDYVEKRRSFYTPGDAGYEREVRERLSRWDAASPVEDPEGT